MKDTSSDDRFKVWFVDDDYNPQNVSRLRHSYTGHPLLTLEALKDLAERLHETKTGQVKYLASGVKLDSDFRTLTENQKNLSIAEVFDNMKNPGSWIALYAVQSDPRYRKLVWDIVKSVKQDWQKQDPGVFFVDGYIFISSAPSVTPFHIDRENNFLLQLAGRKKFGVWNPDNKDVLTEEAKEGWIVKSSLSKVKYKNDYLESARVHDVLEAGEGIYMPSTSPHMTYANEDLTTPDSPYSITMGVVFYTKRTRKLANIYFFNTLIRRLGMAPTAPGKNAVLDTFKYFTGKVLVFLSKATRRYYPPTGF